MEGEDKQESSDGKERAQEEPLEETEKAQLSPEQLPKGAGFLVTLRCGVWPSSPGRAAGGQTAVPRFSLAEWWPVRCSVPAR